MNLGGRRISNEELRAHLAALGLADAQPFRASGNVIFSAQETDEEELQASVETGLEKRLGYPVPTFIRSATQLHGIVAACPFPAELVEASAGKLQVALLAAAPSGQARSEVLALSDEEDQLALAGRELYWLPNGRMSASTLDLKALERVTGLMTVRTMGTIERIVERL